MSILKIYQYPEAVLREETRKVESFDDELGKLVEDMADTMYAAPGIGLAAPQVGRSLKVVVLDTSRDADRKYFAMINPEIIAHEGSQFDEEGCLSVPELIAQVKRHRRVTVTFQDLAGAPRELCAQDRFAVVLQHELDHLDGVLFLDHLSPLKRSLYKKKVRKWQEEE